MADGSGGSNNLGGVLFEAGNSAVKATGGALANQAKQTANATFSSLTGSQKPLFSKPQGSSLPKMPPGQKPDPFAGLKMFENGGAKSPFGPKQQIPQAPTGISQEELAQMAAENEKKDAEEIAKKQAELEEIKRHALQAHKALHDEVYYNKIKAVGEGMMEQTRSERANEDEQALQAKQEAEQAKQMEALPGTPLNPNGQLGQLGNIAKQQAQTKREANRGTSG